MGDLPKLARSRDATGKEDNIHSKFLTLPLLKRALLEINYPRTCDKVTA